MRIQSPSSFDSAETCSGCSAAMLHERGHRGNARIPGDFPLGIICALSNTKMLVNRVPAITERTHLYLLPDFVRVIPLPVHGGKK